MRKFLNPLPHNDTFWRPGKQAFWKNWEKEKFLITNNFSFSHTVFYPFGLLSAIFVKFEIVVCKLFQFGRVKNLSSGNGLTFHLLLLNHKRLSIFTSQYLLCHVFLCPCMNRLGAYRFGLSVSSSACLFVCKNFYIGQRFWIVSDTAFIFHLWVMSFLSYQSQGHLSGQGQISRSVLNKMAIAGASMVHKHILFFFV